MEPDQAILNRWSGAAPFWEKYREEIRRMFAPVTDALVAEVSIAAGQSVLDVATGPGEPALTIAALVGPQGRVAGIDPIPGMVAAARRAAEQLRFTHVQFDVALADALPFPDAAFDTVVSRFGVMFFPAPLEAVREMLRVLKPGGKLALAVWSYVDRNPFFHTLQQVVDRHVDAAVPPDPSDPFCFAEPGKLRQILADAGATALSEQTLSFAIQAPLSPEQFWTLRCEMSEKLREKLATLSGDQLTEAKRESLQALAAYCSPGGISFPAEVLIVSASKIA